ncbi:hypothetical protein [Francisella sp. 19X1-34]|uniref:hypothetical protein n=1 Tax=Francisella sp. 19X1-34 TaxID=3087177 RepID=UPI002E336D8F|nr:hypothetical protein [Francisella sp. 19X1-34]MED7787738.1 hypothetical protein [Francisella sp. 19X1-34]
MRIFTKFYTFVIIAALLTGCAWYKGPPLQANADADLSGSALNKTSGANIFSTLKSAQKDGSGYTGFADDGGNFETTSFDNVA